MKAEVELARPDAFSEEDVIIFLEDRLAKYKTPEIIEFMNQIPRYPTGKIFKKELW